MHQSGWMLVAVFVSSCAADTAPPIAVEGDFVGAWRFLPRDPTRTPVEELEVVTLRADGSYSIRDRRGTDSGTYEVDGRDLTIRSNAGGWVTTGMAATADWLIVDALFRDDASTELAGMWRGGQSSADVTTTVELELRTDGTAHIEQTGEVADVVDATWVREDPYVLVTFANPTRTKAMPAIPAVAIGEWLYERIE